MAEKVVTVGKADQVRTGQLAAFDVDGRRVAVANVDGRYYAFDDVCTHEECSLAEGELEGMRVTCPCHGGQFDVASGAAVTPPVVTPVKTYQVRLEGGELRIEI